jgi:hypothetical protein
MRCLSQPVPSRDAAWFSPPQMQGIEQAAAAACGGSRGCAVEGPWQGRHWGWDGGRGCAVVGWALWVTLATQDDALVLQADCSWGLGEHGDLALQTSNTTSFNVDFCMCVCVGGVWMQLF